MAVVIRVRTMPVRPGKSRKSWCTALEIYVADNNTATYETMNGNKGISYYDDNRAVMALRTCIFLILQNSQKIFQTFKIIQKA